MENINGRLRRDLPRKTDIDKMSDADIADIAFMHNRTPCKCLGFKTPLQALLQQLGIDAILSFHRGVALQSCKLPRGQIMVFPEMSNQMRWLFGAYRQTR